MPRRTVSGPIPGTAVVWPRAHCPDTFDEPIVGVHTCALNTDSEALAMRRYLVSERTSDQTIVVSDIKRLRLAP